MVCFIELLLLCSSTRILVTVFVGTAIAFGCFSGAAIIAKRREYLYLGGLLSSGLSFFSGCSLLLQSLATPVPPSFKVNKLAYYTLQT